MSQDIMLEQRIKVMQWIMRTYIIRLWAIELVASIVLRLYVWFFANDLEVVGNIANIFALFGFGAVISGILCYFIMPPFARYFSKEKLAPSESKK